MTNPNAPVVKRLAQAVDALQGLQERRDAMQALIAAHQDGAPLAPAEGVAATESEDNRK